MIGVRVSEGSTSSVTVRHLVDWLEAGGDDLGPWLEAAGVAREALGSPDLRVPLEAFDALWARAVARDAGIGLGLIERFPPGQLHLVTHLALRAATVGDALQAAARFIAATDPRDRLEQVDDPGGVAFRYRHPGLEAGRRHNPGFVEHLLAMAHRLLSQGVGRALPLRAVRFAGPRLAPPAAYLARFGVAPAFGAADNALVLDPAVLAWPLATRDDYLRDLLERMAGERLPADAGPMQERVAALLRRAWTDGRGLDLAAAAAALGCTPARLRQQLAAAGTGFRALCDATRREAAERHLAGTLPVGEISWRLGFSEPAAFQHAVRRWFGASAGEVRARLAGAPARRGAS